MITIKEGINEFYLINIQTIRKKDFKKLVVNDKIVDSSIYVNEAFVGRSKESSEVVSMELIAGK